MDLTRLDVITLHYAETILTISLYIKDALSIFNAITVLAGDALHSLTLNYSIADIFLSNTCLDLLNNINLEISSSGEAGDASSYSPSSDSSTEPLNSPEDSNKGGKDTEKDKLVEVVTPALEGAITSDLAAEQVLTEVLSNYMGVDDSQPLNLAESQESKDKRQTAKKHTYFFWRYIDHFDIYGPVIIPAIIVLMFIVYMIRQSIPTSTLFNKKHSRGGKEREEASKLALIVSKVSRLFIFLKKSIQNVLKK